MRKAINTLVEGKLYQRGQILTWKLEEKRSLIQENNIGIVVNFWPKVDSDMSDLAWYFHIPSGSEQLMSPEVEFLAYTVAELVRDDDCPAALILCEAGKTRSVYFATLVLAELLDISYKRAYTRMMKLLPTNKMKTYMVEYLTHEGQ